MGLLQAARTGPTKNHDVNVAACDATRVCSFPYVTVLSHNSIYHVHRSVPACRHDGLVRPQPHTHTRFFFFVALHCIALHARPCPVLSARCGTRLGPTKFRQCRGNARSRDVSTSPVSIARKKKILHAWNLSQRHAHTRHILRIEGCIPGDEFRFTIPP